MPSALAHSSLAAATKYRFRAEEKLRDAAEFVLRRNHLHTKSVHRTQQCNTIFVLRGCVPCKFPAIQGADVSPS
jgi:hypothetical protein